MARTKHTRRKGVTFEREVADAFREAGFEVRGLEASGDHLVIELDGPPLHVECKRQERLRVPEWIEQVERDCPQGVRWVLVFRQSNKPAYLIQRLDNYLEERV